MIPKLCALLLFLPALHCAPSFPGQADRVTAQLPGVTFSAANITHYSGYFETPNGTYLHYWFFESTSAHSSTDPLVLWLTGGPGCSSLVAALTENGPFQYNSNGSITSNAFSWNRVANVLYLESPAGVGFSFNAQDNYNASDLDTARLNAHALEAFYQKFPQYRDSDFYITGESYGGIYIPTLATLLVEQKFPKNFRGFAIGNGLYDYSLLGKSAFFFYYYHGFVPEPAWSDVLEHCCPNTSASAIHDCNLVINQDRACQAALGRATGQVTMNPYNINQPCYKAKNNVEEIFESADYHYVREQLFLESMPHGAARDFFTSATAKVTPESGNVPCFNYGPLTDWLNSPEVKKALHINMTHSLPWAACRRLPYERQFENVTKEMAKLAENPKMKILIYNGADDMMCNFLSNQWFIKRLLKNPFHYNNSHWLYEGQLAGYNTVYDELTFTLVHNAGHMVPESKPAQALDMIGKFLARKN